MKIVKVQHTFSGGEVSPVIHQARTDLELYRKSLVECHNYIPLVQGSLIRRPPMVDLEFRGDHYPRKSLKYRDLETKNEFLIIPSHNKSKIFDLGSEKVIAEINTPWGLEDVEKLDYVQVRDMLLVVHQDYQPVLLYPKKDGEEPWVVEAYAPTTGPYMSPNYRPVEYPGDIQLTIMNNIREQKKEPEFSKKEQLDKDYSGPSLFSYVSKTTGNKTVYSTSFLGKEISGNSGALKEYFIDHENGIEASEDSFDSLDVGRHITFESKMVRWEYGRLYSKGAKVINENMVYECVEHFPEKPYDASSTRSYPSGTGIYFDAGRYVWKKLYPATEDNIYFQYYGIINEFVSAKKVKAIIFDKPNSFHGKITTSKWSLGSWCKEEGYPSLVTLHDGRLVFSGYKKRPSHIDFSEIITSKDFRETGFKPTDGEGKVQKNSALSLSMDFGARKEEKIQWMEGFNHKFLIGTDKNEWELGSASTTDGFSPVSFKFHCISSYGSERINPIRIGRSLVFVQRTGRILRELKIGKENAYTATDLMLYASHLTDGNGRGIKQIAYQKTPHSILWVVTHDGRLLGCTIDLDSSLYGWHTHDIADTDEDNPSYTVRMIADYTDGLGNDGVIIGADSGPNNDSSSPQLIKMSSFEVEPGTYLDFNGSQYESTFHSYVECPRLDEALEPAYVGGKRRLVATKIRVENTKSMMLGTVDNNLVKAKIDDPDGLCLAEATLNTTFGRDEGLFISQKDNHGGKILQVLTISEIENVR